jgi:hypothetical protein
LYKLFLNVLAIFEQMKKLLFLLSFAGIVSCKSEPENAISVYQFVAAGNTGSAYREYRVTDDSVITKVWLKQGGEQLNDSTWQFTTLWLNADSLPINAGVERYFTSNAVQLIKQSYFEQIGEDRVVEINGKIDTTLKQLILNKPGAFDIHFQSASDSAITMHIVASIKAKIIPNDAGAAADEKTLEIISSEINNINFSDGRSDTAISTSTRRVYTLSKGLVYFEVGDSDNTMTFKLVE